MIVVLGVCAVVVCVGALGGLAYAVAHGDLIRVSRPAGDQPRPYDQQILHVGLQNYAPDIETLDPALTGSGFVAQQIEQLIFPALVTTDASLNVVPWAAQRLPTVTDGGRVYTFQIRTGLRWSDGAPIDAQTFAYSLNRALQPCVAPQRSTLPFVYFLYAIQGAAALNQRDCASTPPGAYTLIGSSLRVVDPLTLQITLAQPDAAFLAELTIPAALAVPQQLITRYGAVWTNHLAGFGGNLFALNQWRHDGTLSLAQNPNSFIGKPKLKAVDFTFYHAALTSDSSYNDAANDVARLAYSSGDLDVAQLAPVSWPLVKSRTDTQITPLLGLDYLQPNWTMAPFDNLLARQAFALALDKSALVGNGSVVGAYGPLIATNHIIPLGNPGYNPRLVGVDGQPTVAGDVTLARQDIARYASVACGGAVKNCPPVRLYYANAYDLAMAQAILAQWQAALPGYPMSLTTYSGDILVAVPPQESVWLAHYVYDYPDPRDWTSVQFLPPFGVPVSDPIVNALMSKADGDQNATERYRLYQQAEQRLVTDCAWIPLDQRENVTQVNPQLHGYALTATGFPPLGGATGWLETYLITDAKG